MVDFVTIAGAALSIIRVLRMAVGGLLDDKPRAKQAVLSGAAGAESALETYLRFASIAEKVRNLPPGTDFTDDDLVQAGLRRDEILAIRDTLLAQDQPQEPSEASIG